MSHSNIVPQFNGFATAPKFNTSHRQHACMSTCGLVFRCLCRNRKSRRNKSHCGRSCVQRPLTAERGELHHSLHDATRDIRAADRASSSHQLTDEVCVKQVGQYIYTYSVYNACMWAGIVSIVQYNFSDDKTQKRPTWKFGQPLKRQKKYPET